MKRITTFIMLAMAVVAVNAQKAMIKTAESLLDDGKLKEALEAIQVAENNDESKIMPKTYYIKGKILQAIGASADSTIRTMLDNPYTDAYNSYIKSVDMDEKKKFKRDVEMQFITFANLTLNAAIENFKAAKYKNACSLFELTLKIEENPVFKNMVDTAVIFNAGIAASYIPDNDKAIAYYTKSIELNNYGGSNTYSLLKNVYLAKGDTADAEITLQKAFQVYPEDMSVIIELVNYYIVAGKAPEAISFLNKAKVKDPSNTSFHFAEGTLYEKLNQPDNALKAYQAAIAIKPDFFDAYFNIGVMFYNQAVKHSDVANKTNDNKVYEEYKNKADDALKQALPYMEKAHELTPTDKAPLESLKTIYFRINNTEKLKEVKEKLSKLQ